VFLPKPEDILDGTIKLAALDQSDQVFDFIAGFVEVGEPIVDLLLDILQFDLDVVDSFTDLEVQFFIEVGTSTRLPVNGKERLNQFP
jgi:hypothetical protein